MDFITGVEKFLSELRRRGYSERTIHAYSFDLEKFSGFASTSINRSVSEVELSQINGDLCRRWVDRCLSSGNTPKTVARKVATLKSFFKFLFQEGDVSQDPTERMRLPRIPKKAPSSLSQDEIRQLLNAPSPDDKDYLLDRAILSLLYSAGLRVSELASLRMENINLERRQIIVTGKGAKERVLPLQSSIISILLEYFISREKRLPNTISPRQPAFIRETSSGIVPMNVRRIQYLVERYGRKASLVSHVHPHLLRHSIATHLIEQGCNVEAVRQTLGHEDLATTSIYLKTASKFLLDEHKKFNPTDDLLK